MMFILYYYFMNFFFFSSIFEEASDDFGNRANVTIGGSVVFRFQKSNYQNGATEDGTPINYSLPSFEVNAI